MRHEWLDLGAARAFRTRFRLRVRTQRKIFPPGTVISSSEEPPDSSWRSEDSPDKFSEAQTIKTEYGAKTMGLDTKTHNIFVDTADFGPAPAPTAERPHPQGPAIQGTFHVLVYGK